MWNNYDYRDLSRPDHYTYRPKSKELRGEPDFRIIYTRSIHTERGIDMMRVEARKEILQGFLITRWVYKSSERIVRYKGESAWYSYEEDAKADKSNFLNKKGTLNLLSGKYDIALECFDKAIELDPTIAIYHANRAASLNELNRYEDALLAAEIALGIDRHLQQAKNQKELAAMGLYNNGWEKQSVADNCATSERDRLLEEARTSFLQAYLAFSELANQEHKNTAYLSDKLMIKYKMAGEDAYKRAEKLDSLALKLFERGQERKSPRYLHASIEKYNQALTNYQESYRSFNEASVLDNRNEKPMRMVKNYMGVVESLMETATNELEVQTGASCVVPLFNDFENPYIRETTRTNQQIKSQRKSTDRTTLSPQTKTVSWADRINMRNEEKHDGLCH